MNKRRGITCALIAFAMALPLLGHHSFSAEYDHNTIISITGKLTRFDWSNPHTYAVVEVTGPNGAKAPWIGETGLPPHLLYGLGLTREATARLMGQTVTMRGAWAKNRTARMGNVDLKTDKGFLMTSRPDTAPRSAHNVGLDLKTDTRKDKDDAILVVSLAASADRRSGKDELVFFGATPAAGVYRIDEMPGCPLSQQFAVTWASQGACAFISEGATPPSRFTLLPGDYVISSPIQTCVGVCDAGVVPVECRAQISVKRGETLYVRFVRATGGCASATSSTPESARERDIQKDIDAGRYQSLEFPGRAPRSRP